MIYHRPTKKLCLAVVYKAAELEEKERKIKKTYIFTYADEESRQIHLRNYKFSNLIESVKVLNILPDEQEPAGTAVL